MAMIAIRFHSTDELDYEKQLGFDDEPDIVIENFTDRQVTIDCFGHPQDDNYTEILYMECNNSEADSKMVFDFLQNCLHDNSNLLIEIYSCDNKLDFVKLLCSNATNDIYYGYGWRLL